MKQIKSDSEIQIYIDEGCITCPFAGERNCNIETSVGVTHDFSYPTKCPLLRKKVIASIDFRKIDMKGKTNEQNDQSTNDKISK